MRNLVVTKKTSIKEHGLSKKTKSSLTTSEFMVRVVGVPFPKLLVSVIFLPTQLSGFKLLLMRVYHWRELKSQEGFETLE